MARDPSRAIWLDRRKRVLQIHRAVGMLLEAMTPEEREQYPVIPQLLELLESHVNRLGTDLISLLWEHVEKRGERTDRIK